MPAITPSVTPIPLTLAPQRFAADLAAWQPPQPYLAPLGHRVSTDAPSGSVNGLAHPTVQRTADGGPPLVLRQPPPAPPADTLQRAFRWPSSPTAPEPAEQPPVFTAVETPVAPPAVATDHDHAETPPAPAPVAPPPAELTPRVAPVLPDTPVPTVSRLVDASALPLPVRHLPAEPAPLPPLATPPVLPHAGAPDEPVAPLLDSPTPPSTPAAPAEPVVQRSAADPAMPLRQPPAPEPAPDAHPHLTAPRTFQAPVDEPAAPAPEPAAPEPAAAPAVPVQRSVEPAAPVDAPVLADRPAPVEPAPRKLGLGEPLRHRPDAPPPGSADGPAMPLQRKAETPAPPTLGLGPPLGSSARTSLPATPPPESLAPAASPPPADPTPAMPLAVPPPVPAAGEDAVIQRSADEGGSGDVFTADAPVPQPPADEQVAPLLGGAPDAAPGAADDAAVTAPEAPLPPLPLQRSAIPEPDTTTTAVPLPAPPSQTAPAMPLLRSLTTPQPAGGQPTGPSTVAPLLGASSPRLFSQPLPDSGPAAASTAVAVQRQATTTTPTSVPAPTTTATAAPASLGLPGFAVPPSVQRAVVAPPALPTVFRPASGGGITPQAFAADPGSAAAPASTAGAFALPVQRSANGAAAPQVAPHGGPNGAAFSAPALPVARPAGTTGPAAPSPASSPLLLQRFPASPAAPAPEPAPAPPEMGLEALLSQGIARREAGGGIAFNAPADEGGAGGGGEGEPAGEGGGEGAAGGGALGHPRTWSAEILDEVSRRIYGPLSRRLKQELRTDRERGGRLMDIRR